MVLRGFNDLEGSTHFLGRYTWYYGPKHSKMIEAKSQLSSSHTTLESEVKKVEYSIQR